MSKSNVFNFKDIDDVNTGFQNTSGWFKKLQTSSSKSNRELDRHPILRLKNVDDLNAVSGVIRFNEEKLGGPVFEGYDGLEWTSFNNTQGLTGKDGINYKTVVDGNNLSNSSDSKSDYYPLFKNVIESNIKTDTIKDDTIESKVSATIHKLPTFKYDSNYTNKQFNLSNHNIIFEPNDTNSYKVIVNKNDSWPPVDYSTHEKYSSTNSNVKLSSNNYFWKNLPSKFNFYNNEYETVYINENGYLTFGIGESAFVQNLLANHFSKSRISALFLNLTNDTEDTNQGSFTVGDSDIFIGTGKYNEYVITFQNYIHNPGTINYRVDLMIAQGLLEEAKLLYAHRNLNALQTVGYRELFSFFDGEITKEFAIEEIKKNTRRFAKRQLTWFRKDTDILWFDFEEAPENILRSLEVVI